ncbi:MAG: hypothetical protein B6I20_05040 [Bacteroidetes bacterium 4572_117]|nr:MAG: hypothetical protein B6I20_05040 [Bacteroidetes bacterium 4572_117]
MLLSNIFQIVILFDLVMVESLWKIYKKAGKNGCAAIIRIYNIIVHLEIIKKLFGGLLCY